MDVLGSHPSCWVVGGWKFFGWWHKKVYATIFVDSEEAEFMGYFTVGLHLPQRRSSGCEAGEGKLGFFIEGED